MNLLPIQTASFELISHKQQHILMNDSSEHYTHGECLSATSLQDSWRCTAYRFIDLVSPFHNTNMWKYSWLVSSQVDNNISILYDVYSSQKWRAHNLSAEKLTLLPHVIGGQNNNRMGIFILPHLHIGCNLNIHYVYCNINNRDGNILLCNFTN